MTFMRRDKAVENYRASQKSQITKSPLKHEYQNACNMIIEDIIDLELIRQAPYSDFLIKSGVKRGISEHVVGDITTGSRSTNKLRMMNRMKVRSLLSTVVCSIKDFNFKARPLHMPSLQLFYIQSRIPKMPSGTFSSFYQLNQCTILQRYQSLAIDFLHNHTGYI